MTADRIVECLTKGLELHENGDRDGAAQAFAAILEMDPRYEPARRYLRLLSKVPPGGDGQVEVDSDERAAPAAPPGRHFRGGDKPRGEIAGSPAVAVWPVGGGPDRATRARARSHELEPENADERPLTWWQALANPTRATLYVYLWGGVLVVCVIMVVTAISTRFATTLSTTVGELGEVVTAGSEAERVTAIVVYATKDEPARAQEVVSSLDGGATKALAERYLAAEKKAMDAEDRLLLRLLAGPRRSTQADTPQQMAAHGAAPADKEGGLERVAAALEATSVGHYVDAIPELLGLGKAPYAAELPDLDFHLGVAMLGAGRQDDAAPLLQAAIASDIHARRARRLAAATALERHDLAAALSLSNELLEAPADAAEKALLNYLKGVVMMEGGNAETALPLLKAAQTGALAENAGLAAAIARAYEVSGRLEDARTAYLRATRLDPGNETVRQAIVTLDRQLGLSPGKSR
ncbi:MAG: tetratricopeptide repeat protein [Candidatus Schekmanbacteria bacterium]|nr:tetratricopeptide repeat protein [Candidatus Schekmanbacteria bacterium]